MQNAKLPPQAIELERAVLGALLLDKDAILAIANILPENAFYSEKNGMIYKAVKQLSKEGMQIDLITISLENLSLKIPCLISTETRGFRDDLSIILDTYSLNAWSVGNLPEDM